MLSTDFSERNSCGKYSSVLFIIVHQLAVNFDIGTEDGREFTFLILCDHANTSFKRWRRHANRRGEFRFKGVIA
jgi:hypothetical protein